MFFHDIESIIALSEARSISQAADRLYLSRSAFSQRIAQLEKKFGTPLFTRTPTGVEMTQAGNYVTAFAHNVEKLERTLASQLESIDESFIPTLEIGMSLNDGVALLPGIVGKYMREINPDARCHLEAGYEPQLVEKLANGTLDMAILENQPDIPEIKNEVLGYKKLIFIAPNLPPYNRVIHPLPVETLLKWPMIIYKWDSGRHMVGNRHFRERYGISLSNHNVIACFDTHDAMVNGVREGIGWCCIPDCVYSRYRNDQKITRLKVNTPAMWYPVNFACGSNRVPSVEARRFASFLRQNIPEGYFDTSLEAFINS